MKKKSWLYFLIVFLWLLCDLLLIGSVVYISLRLQESNIYKKIAIISLLAVNCICLSYFWLNSIKDFMYSFIYAINHRKIMKRYDVINSVQVKDTPKFVLLYCTCNDFNADALSKCMKQSYENYETVILDDSTKEEYLTQIDEFASKNNVKVVRRENKTGFKAGNLNNYLQNNTDYDYFVVLDSDEIIPSYFIKECLKYFYFSSKIGVVQASHIATKSSNAFQKILGISVKSTSFTSQIMKNFYGANALIGHGMAIKKECYVATGGFPHVVAEDISFAVDVKKSGFDIIYAPNIICEEEFPTDYIALKKRQCKWTQGNVEYMKKYSKNIKKSGMKWYEKLDLKLSHYSLPIIPMLSFFILIATISLGFFSTHALIYSVVIFAISIFFLLSPLLPNIFVYGKSKQALLIVPYLVLSMVTYASLTPMMIKTVTLAIFGKKARFIVTPKNEKKISLFEAFKYSIDSFLFAIIIGALTYFSFKNVLPSILFVICCLFAPVVILLANIKTKEKKNKKIKNNDAINYSENIINIEQNVNNENKNLVLATEFDAENKIYSIKNN